jgi:hypothetical protein
LIEKEGGFFYFLEVCPDDHFFLGVNPLGVEEVSHFENQFEDLDDGEASLVKSSL